MKAKIIKVVRLLFNVMNGRFGNRVLKPQYRQWWVLFTWGTFAILFFVFVMRPFYEWWDKVVYAMNAVIRGW